MSKTVAAVIGILAAVGIGVLYFRIDPARAVWMPHCPFRLLTGWECPACGSQRALHALLHGQPLAALRFNPFLIVSLPYLAAVALTTFGRGERIARWRGYVQHRVAILGYAVLFIAWWIVRNTPLIA